MKLEVCIHKKLKEFDLNVEFTAENGCTGFMGSSGSGKSMTLKCIAGIEKPDSGRIVLGDRVLFDSEKHIDIVPGKRHVGYLFQSYALFPNMTVRKNIEEGARILKLDKEGKNRVVEEMLAKFHIDELANRYPKQLSGGQKQRVALARLMAGEPEVILLDEPFSALDEELKDDLQNEMKKLLESLNKPSILVSHDKNEVTKLCDSLYKIHKGEFIK